jgi:phosphoglycerate dehydrogenase-like enzyme
MDVEGLQWSPPRLVAPEASSIGPWDQQVSTMSETQHILFLDDDHVLRLARFALAGTQEVSEDWVHAFFSPLGIDPQSVFDLAHGLHSNDGVTLYPLGTPAKMPEHAGRSAPLSPFPAEILIFRRGEVDAQLMDQHPHLRFIQRLGMRLDGIDLEAAQARGIQISCLPRRSLQYTAEHTLLFMLALSKRLLEGDQAVRLAQWETSKLTPTDEVAYNWVALEPLSGLFEKTLGIIGMGEVGALLAKMALACGMNVVYCNRHRLSHAQEQSLGVSYAAWDDLLAESDFVSVNASNLPSNQGMINANTFKNMKKTAFFINTARGKLVDEQALHDALRQGHIAGAALDVHWREPREAHHPLMNLPNVLFTPHYAGGERGEVLHELSQVFDNCRRVLKGLPPLHRVS